MLLSSLFGWKPESLKRKIRKVKMPLISSKCWDFQTVGHETKLAHFSFFLFVKLFWNTTVLICLCVPCLLTHYDYQPPEYLVLQNLKYLLYGTWQKKFISSWLVALLYTFRLIKFHSYPVRWEIISLTRCRFSDPERYLPQVQWFIRSRAQIWIWFIRLWILCSFNS